MIAFPIRGVFLRLSQEILITFLWQSNNLLFTLRVGSRCDSCQANELRRSTDRQAPSLLQGSWPQYFTLELQYLPATAETIEIGIAQILLQEISS